MLHIVTDSTSDLTQDEARGLDVTVVPLIVRFGDEQLRDGIDIDPTTFYRRLPTASTLPTTSQPSPEQFVAVYRECLTAPDDRVLSVHLSGKLSGTLQSATIAAQDFSGRVDVVDSGSVSLGLQLLVRAAASDRAAGVAPEAITAATRERAGRVMCLILLDTLTYLEKGGRIGKAQAFLGSVLNVKPLLKVVDGEVHPLARVRSRHQGLARMVERVDEVGELEALGSLHSAAPELLDEVGRRLAATHPGMPIITGQLGAVVGTYAGPNAIGVAYLRAAPRG